MAKQVTQSKAGPAAAPQEANDGKITYEIVRPAPPRIALQLVLPDQTEIRLTEVEARAEVLAGHIRPKMPAAPASNAD